MAARTLVDDGAADRDKRVLRPKPRPGGLYRKVLSAGAALAVFLLPALALACPVCAGRSGGGPWRGVLLGLFIFFPFAIVAGVIRFMRSEERHGGAEGDAADRGELATRDAIP